MREPMSSVVETPRADRLPPSGDPAKPTVEAKKDLPLTIIEPQPGWKIVDWCELVRYHELLFFLIWRDVKVRYKQTVLGVAWAVLQPLATMFVFVLFLGRMADVSKNIENYSLFVFAGMLPWTFF